MNEIKRRRLGTLALMGALFLNPLGYDALFYMVLQLTGNSYALTTCIFYLLSALLFGLYFYLANINPVNWFKSKKDKIKKTKCHKHSK